MRIKSIVWDQETVTHIWKHGVEPQEVDEVCFDMAPLILKARHGRYFALGQTSAGRYLAIIFEYLENNTVKIITARAMAEDERKIYKRR